MNEKNFEQYGTLNGIAPEQYYSEPWTYVCSDFDDDGGEWAIVRNISTNEYAYTLI